MYRFAPHVLALCALASTTVTLAQPSDDERARSHFQAGQSYYDQGRYAESAEQFDEAHRLSGRPQLLANAALAYERGGDLARAIERLEAFVASNAPEATSQATTLERRLASLRERLEAERVAAEAQAEAARATSAAAAPSVPGPPVRDRRGMRVAGLATSGAGLGIGVVSLVTGVVAHGVHGDLERVCGPAGDACPESAAGDIERGRRLARLSTATTAIAIAAVGTGIALVVTGRRRSEPARVDVRVGASPGGATLVIGGTF